MKPKCNVAVVTGAASGLGLAISQRCLERGMNVVMADIDKTPLLEKVEQLSNKCPGEILGIVTDVTKPESLKQLVENTHDAFARVDWLFNNAGVMGRIAPIWDVSNSEFQSVLDVNLFGVLNGVRAFMPYLLKQPVPSRIINMASMYGLFSGSQVGAYSMSKFAIVSLSESMYFDLQRMKSQVEVSVVCPSFTNTNLLSHAAPLNNDALYKTMTELLSQSRPAEDVASSILTGISKNQFYIFPDLEVKGYCEARQAAMSHQSEPHCHNIEKIMQTYMKRIERPTGETT